MRVIHVSPESRARLARGSATSARLEPMTQQMFMQHGAMLAPRPPLAAYREDLARSGGRKGFGPSDATWLSVATILSHAVDVPPDSRPPLLPTLREAVGSDPALRDVLTASEHDSPREFELDGVSPIVRAIVERMEDEGALNLAYSTLTILADADLRLSVLERGRVLAQLARVARKAGALDTAREHYRRVEVLGRASQIPELRVRAWIGYGIVARLRGNYPDVRKWSARAAHEADRSGLAALGSLAYHGLMIAAAKTGNLNAALVYGWRAFEDAVGDAAREAEMLLNISQLLYEAGHPRVALSGFTAALAREPASRVALPTLGSIALAAAALGDGDRVRAAWGQSERLMAYGGSPYESADVLFELSAALAAVGDASAAGECRTRALEIAARQGYHELTHRLETLKIPPPPARAGEAHALDARASAVACAVASLGLVGIGTSDE
jgi:tetratricopeptide (TPR) repeat protein